MSTTEIRETPWKVNLTRKAAKQANNLPEAINDILYFLKGELEQEGPIQPEWHHYGKLAGKKREYHHCHLNKGKPRYVAIWVVESRKEKILEICFAGTHENVNYRQYK